MTSADGFHHQSVIWGQAFEVLVKRGVLACLDDWKLVDLDSQHLRPWRETKVSNLHRRVVDCLGVIDETVKDQIHAALEHMAATAYGLGYTAMREYLKRIELPISTGGLKLKALWCPLALPGQADFEAERDVVCKSMHQMLGLTGLVDPALADKGMPARADFLLWLSGDHKEDHLLVQEYSFDMPRELGDFRSEDAHLDELLRHRRLVDSRSVFARVAAEVEEEHFDLSKDIKTHLGALTSENKPLYKLCQGCAYAESALRLISNHGSLTKACIARALAITPNGLESLAARFDPASTQDPRFELMTQLGSAYRQTRKFADGDTEGLTKEVESAFKQVLGRLPKALRRGLSGLQDLPEPGQDYCLEFEEAVEGFANTAQCYTRNEALALVPSAAELDTYFNGQTVKAIGRELDGLKPGDEPVTLRDVHAAAIVAGMKRAEKGRLNVIALEGNPGIGKTTAVTRYLAQESSGYFFLYVSPRVVINRDVTAKLARTPDGTPTGILTLTTNAQIISAAERFHQSQVEAGRDAKRKIDGAVVVDGVPNLIKPEGSVLILFPEDEERIEGHYAGSRISKLTLSETEDIVSDKPLMGVLAAMATTTRELLKENRGVNRVVLTAALQGFRERGNGKNTAQALEKLFKEAGEKNRSRVAGKAERHAFAERMPTIVVMVDELAGDGAGAPFVHAIARWLKSEFIEPFGDDKCPFKVILVVSDASLGNEVVLSRYLNAGEQTPDKVLVSRSRGKRPFDLAVSKIKIGSGKPSVLHVMTNSFPASKLQIRYRVNLSAVRIIEKQPGVLETPRQAIRRSADAILLENAASEVKRTVSSGAKQIIYFAQDKLFLRELQAKLSGESELGLSKKLVQILDSSVPASKRKQLVTEPVRDRVKVFLMTSSGARGVSFPKTDVIIATVPRFNVESALMEIAQLIYRGRGDYLNEYGEHANGDIVPRKLIMLIDDFLVHEEVIDRRQWLRQSLDLMTLLVMLRATIYTRITGDAGLRQSLALVPVGSVGVEELISLMSQHVSTFLAEADTFVRGEGSNDLAGLVQKARTNCYELFKRFRLSATVKQGEEGSTFVREREAMDYLERSGSAIAPLLPDSSHRARVPSHVFFMGPTVVERWAGFDKREVFSFEGQLTAITELTKQLYGQLKAIDGNSALPSNLRTPAASLLRLLAREKHGAAMEFNTLKDLKSPNTWIALPATYPQFLHHESEFEERVRTVTAPEMWRTALGRTLATSSALMPAIPEYSGVPWAAGVSSINPLKFDQVFDDRYFMASNELNLLNTLLLAE